MNIIDNKISSFQLLFLVSGFMLGSSRLISFMDVIAHHDTWLVILAAFIIGTPFILSYSILYKRFQGKNLVHINHMIYGRFLGNVFSMIYVLYFVLILSLNINDLANFYVGYIMAETPKLAFLIIFALVSGYAVQKGIEVMARISSLSVFFGILVIIASTLLLLKKADFSNFLPVLEIPLKDFIQSMHIVIALPFCEIAIIFMILPSLNQYANIHKYTLGGYLIAFLGMLIIALRNTAALGPSALLYMNASYQSVRLIDIADFLTRIEVIIALALTFSLFIKVCILYYAAALSLSQLLNLCSYSPLILPIGGITIILALISHDSAVSHFYSARNYDVVWTTPFLLIFPPVTLLIAKLRRLPKNPGGEKQ